MKKENLKLPNHNQNVFLGVFSLINTHFWKAFVGPFFSFGYPLIFVFMIGTIYGYEYIIGPSITIGPIAIACVSLPSALFEFKKSTLFKRIGTSKIKPLYFLLFIALYYLIIMILSGLWTFLLALLVYGPRYYNDGRVLSSYMFLGKQMQIKAPSLKLMFKNIEWFGYIYSFVILSIVSLAVGLFLVSISRSVLMVQAIGSSLLIISMFLTGQVMPLASIAKFKPMWYIGYLSPFKSSIVQNTMSFLGTSELSLTVTIDNQIIDLTPASNNMAYSWNSIKEYTTGIVKYHQVMNSSYGIFLKGKEKEMQELLLNMPNNLSTYESGFSIINNNYNIFKVNQIFNAQNFSYSTIQFLSFEEFMELMITDAFNNKTDENVKLLRALANFKKTQDINNLSLTEIINLAKNNELLKNFYSSSYVKISSNFINKSSIIKIGSVTENIINHILPWIWSGLLFGVSSKVFRWNIR
ncbi:ABC-2 transporter permease [Mycoplasmopsis primatum]|uniref:hypothetical protein n=1 Tax=Mycoplasmopsis primatum TaxID=55604 RepID=UPI000497E0D6|nr:hypothetical protein [Mycoplasmopsis primatum]